MRLLPYIAVPVIMAFGAGTWLSIHAIGSRNEQAEVSRTELVTQESRLAGDAIGDDLNRLSEQALAFDALAAQSRSLQLVPPEPILHWAELEVDPGEAGGAAGAPKVLSIRQAVANPRWNPGPHPKEFADFYLQQSIQRLDLREVRDRGVSVLRFKQDPLKAVEWLALAFPLPRPSTNVVLVLVDPTQVFSIFRRWEGHSAGGKLRAYLIGSDGFVLAHSQPTYVGSDLSGTAIFQKGILEAIKGNRAAGSGSYLAVDQIPVTTAYARIGALPLAVAVERLGSDATELSIAGFAQAVVDRNAGLYLIATGLLVLLVFGCAWLAARNTPGRSRVSGPPAQLVPAGGSRLPESAAIAAFFDESAATPEALQAARRERLLFKRFEDEITRPQDPRQIAARLTGFASSLFGCPSLFFNYYPGIRSAILTAYAGFDGTKVPVLSVPVASHELDQILASEQNGRLASLSNYAPLARVLLTTLEAGEFEAWALTRRGASSVDSALLGVFVTLARPGAGGAGESTGRHLQHLKQILRVTSEGYENATLGH